MRYFRFGAFVWIAGFIGLRWVVHPDGPGWLIGILIITGLALKAADWLHDEDHTVHQEWRGNRHIRWVDYSQPRRGQRSQVVSEPSPQKKTKKKKKKSRPANERVCPKCGSTNAESADDIDTFIEGLAKGLELNYRCKICGQTFQLTEPKVDLSND